DGDLQPLGDVDRLQQTELALVGDVGGEAGGVGERARLLDRAQEGRDAAVVATQLEDLLDHGAVLTRQLDRVLVVGVAVVDFLDLAMQGVAIDARLGGAGDDTVKTDHGLPRYAAARAPVLDHFVNDADAAELAVV